MEKISGVYQIRNIKNNHLYIGSAINIGQRRSKHFSDLRKGKHHSIYLQRAWNIYGEDSFEFSVIETCAASELICKEQYYMDTLIPSYNILPVAGSQLGAKRSVESRRKMSIARKGNPGWWLGKKHSKETLIKIGKASKGRTSWNKGKKNIYAEETILKMRNAKLGKTNSTESKNRASNSMKAMWRNKKENGSHE